MKTYSCPSCGARIALRDINVKSDVMLCRACGMDVVIGSLPLDMAEYFCQWLVYWALQ